ncbi:MAG: hypothetical protein WBA12_05010 [Catalinimonas sp.]
MQPTHLLACVCDVRLSPNPLRARGACLLSLLMLFAACDRLDEDFTEALSTDAFPQQVILKDGGDGDLEDADEAKFTIALTDRIDPTGEELRGTVVPLAQDVTVRFQVSDPAGFSNLADYLLGWTALYDVDDCTTSEDAGIDLNLQFDPTTGAGSVRFPAGVEEIDVAFELAEGLFDDDARNDGRGFTVTLLGLDGNAAGAVANAVNTFDWEVLDDEGISGEWELEVNDANWTALQALLSLVEPDVDGLTAADVNEVAFEVGYEKATWKIELVEEEEVEECGETETQNVAIEVEGDLDGLDRDELTGEIAFEDKVEDEDGREVDFKYEGEYEIVGDTLTLTLAGERDDDGETDEITLVLTR